MSAHHHIQSMPDDDADLARWDDDGAPPAQPRSSPAAWLRVGAELGDQLVALSGRQDLLVTCRPGTRSGAPAAYFPTLGEVEFDARLFAPLQPHEIHPRIVGDEDRYPAAWGVFVHEAAHAAHSVWTQPAGANPRVVEAALLLEESRVEGAHLITRPTDRTYLRTSARTLVMPDIAHPTLQGIEQAAAAAALILGRRDVGILDAGETRAVADLCEKVLGANLLTTLTRIWTAAHQCADHDATTMLAHGQEWCDALDAAAPALPVPEGLSDLLTGAVGVVMDHAAATDAADLAAQDAAANAMASRSKAQAQDRAQRARQRRKAAATAKSVFNAPRTCLIIDLVVGRGELTDEAWERIAPLLPGVDGRGRPWRDHRQVINGVLWRLRTGAPWRDLPERYGPWQTAYERFARWEADGTWARLLEQVQVRDDSVGAVEWTVSVDSTISRAHQHAAGARKKGRRRGTNWKIRHVRRLARRWAGPAAG